MRIPATLTCRAQIAPTSTPSVVGTHRPFRAIFMAALFSLSTHSLSALAFGFTDVDQRARVLANASYDKPSDNLPKELKNLSYEQYRDIRFKADHMLWHNDGLPFELSFFHQGRDFDQPVKINEIVGPRVRPLNYTADAFDFGKNTLDPNKWKGVGYAGFTVRYPMNTPKYKDEVVTFLGASYFRGLGKGQLYGLSARGLALDTALMSGEEFPRFVEFWLERPTAKAKQLTFYGLLDSPRATGAYRFVLVPGTETRMDVSVRLYLRDKVGKLGIAPLTSMYFFAENQRSDKEDFRPEVHDSDGLAIHAGNGEWLWRPLVNPKHLLVTSFATANPGGFGLQQRDRRFSSYEDLAARYDQRPSAWVEPLGAWGPGQVELVQIPTPDETNDNIVAYWVPAQSPQPKEAYALEYRVRWQKDTETHPPMLWVLQTRRGPGYRPKPDDSLFFLVDFVGEEPPLAPDAAAGDLRGQISLDGNGELLESRIERNGTTAGWRLYLHLKRLDQGKPVEMRAALYRKDQPVSETWSYILPPD